MGKDKILKTHIFYYLHNKLSRRSPGYYPPIGHLRSEYLDQVVSAAQRLELPLSLLMHQLIGLEIERRRSLNGMSQTGRLVYQSFISHNGHL